MKKFSLSTKKIAGIGMLAALSVILVTFIHFSIFPAVSFLEYDPADIPIFIGTFVYGPTVGLILTVVVSVLQGLTVSAGSGWIGIVMHIIATGSFVLTAGYIYKFHKTLKGAIISLVSGCLVWVSVMMLCNLALTPLFFPDYDAGFKTVLELLIPFILPFNLIKAGVNSVITFILYKSMHKFLKKYFDEPEKNNKPTQTEQNLSLETNENTKTEISDNLKINVKTDFEKETENKTVGKENISVSSLSSVKENDNHESSLPVTENKEINIVKKNSDKNKNLKTENNAL